MRKLFLFLLILFVLLIFSCAGKPKTVEDTPDPTQSQSIVEETEESPEPEDELASDQQEETTETEIADAPETDDSITEDELAETDLTEQGEPVTETAVEEEPAPTETPVIVEAPPIVETPAQTISEPVAQTPVPEQPPDLLVQAEEESLVDNEDDAEQDSEQERQEGVPFRYEPPFVSAVRDDDSLPVRPGARIPRTEEIHFSRAVRAVVGQIIEIPFRGTGWVYLGELTSRRGIVYNSRRLDPQGQSFIFTAEEAGSYALKFYRQDFIRDYILNDYVQVIVGEVPEAGAAWFNTPFDRGRVIAQPRWPSALEEAEIQRGGNPGSRPAAETSADSQRDGASQARSSPQMSGSQQASGTSQTDSSTEPLAYVESAPRPQRETVTQSPVQEPAGPSQSAPSILAPEKENVPPQTTGAPPAQTPEEKLPLEDALVKAKETFDEGNVAAAIALLDKYMEYYPSGSDELYWLLGQFYEANTPSRNILLSLDYYRRLVREYPQSSRLNDARRRIAYLERFYININ